MVSPDGQNLIARRYRLLRKLGQGGMGAVWEGHDALLDRQVAIKEVLLPAGLSGVERERQLQRTSREARTAAKINHSGIVAIYDVAEQDGRPWIIMELVKAPSLDRVVAETGSVPTWQTADIGRQVLSALMAAHAAGVLHRDVKPANILVTAEGRAVLTDFGIATVAGDSSLTQTGMLTGSPAFLAPERARGGETGPASDLWSLGATLYAAVIGRSPFERGETMATLSALLTEEPDFGRVPPALHPALKGMLERDPARRIGAEEADRLLAEVAAPEGERRSRGRSPGRGRGRRAAPKPGGGRLALIAASLVVLVGGGTTAILAMTSGADKQADASAKRPAAPSASPVAAGEQTSAAPATSAASPSVSPSPSRTLSPYKRYRSAAGWSVDAPRTWRGSVNEGYTQWVRRDGKARLGIEEINSYTGAMEILTDMEVTLKPQVDDYARGSMRNVAWRHGPAVEWDFTFTATGREGQSWLRPGVTYRELRRVLMGEDRALVLQWTVEKDAWVQQFPAARQVLRSLTPKG
ncbi:Serine/threonine protein kinase [Sinosporangium album]|uniref:non-specific serine/threonine protein kinase n=1 Tax=Sinosporangium album TaxID=504805 RepID=A0A1G7TA95_9ACTN|nr:serine/threonine-protein kinase [Sinosporangium album]SDG32185.1 Serine/threonine protein kinase [Sinosporangium album]